MKKKEIIKDEKSIHKSGVYVFDEKNGWINLGVYLSELRTKIEKVTTSIILPHP